MKKTELTINITSYNLNELADEDRQLVEMAKQATDNAYAPYSGFKVGTCGRRIDGSTFIGTNQENAAYPSGLCAERTALFGAMAQDPEHAITTLAIAARNGEGSFTKTPIVPCGACRQVMLEVEARYHQPMRILLYGTDGIIAIDSAKDLMPLSFSADSMR